MMTLREIPEGITLKEGDHVTFEAGACVMELVAYLAGAPHTDKPACACPVITSFCIAINDRMPDDATRTRHLLPLVTRIAGSRANAATERVRASLAADWAVRHIAAKAMEIAGLRAEAEKLKSLAKIDNPTAARAAAYAANSAAYAAARSANAAAYAAAEDPREEIWRDAVALIEQMIDCRVEEVTA
jgi:hypothetical protein